MPLSQKQSSPRSLNNEGVLLLQEGRYEDAARCFAIAVAVNTTSSSRPLQERQPQATKKKAGARSIDGCETTNCRKEPTAEPPKRQPEIVEDGLDVQSPQQEEETRWVPSNLERRGSCTEPPRKRRRGANNSSEVTTARLVPSSVSNLGRPIWIQSKKQRTVALDSNLFSATVLYNFGLSLHLIAINEDQISRRLLYTERALGLYKLAEEEMARVPLSITAQAPGFAVVVLHNISQVYSTIMTESSPHRQEEASRYQDRLADALRFVRASCRQKQYETFFIQLLSLTTRATTSRAAAA